MEGLLDPKQIVGPHYFGNTEHKKGDMVGFVTGKLQDAKLWTGDQRSQVIAAPFRRSQTADTDHARPR